MPSAAARPSWRPFPAGYPSRGCLSAGPWPGLSSDSSISKSPTSESPFRVLVRPPFQVGHRDSALSSSLVRVLIRVNSIARDPARFSSLVRVAHPGHLSESLVVTRTTVRGRDQRARTPALPCRPSHLPSLAVSSESLVATRTAVTCMDLISCPLPRLPRLPTRSYAAWRPQPGHRYLRGAPLSESFSGSLSESISESFLRVDGLTRRIGALPRRGPVLTVRLG